MDVLSPPPQQIFLYETLTSIHTVESLLTDTPNKGHCIKYLSIMDKTKSPNFNLPINIMQLESLNRGHSLLDKPFEFILVPKCPLFGDSTVIGFVLFVQFKYI